MLSSCSAVEDNNISELSTSKNIEKNILALWDSLTAWYNLDLSEAYPAQLELLLDGNYKITNAWVSWDTSQNLLDRIGLYDQLNPDIYLLTIWWNDGLRRQSVINMKNNIWTIIEHLQWVNPDATIVLSGMQMPINYWLKYASDFKKVYPELAEEYELPFFEFFLEWVVAQSNLNLSDWIHPNKAWYEIIANNIYNFLKKEDIIIK
jgi:acyl-CoA thioesterase-1